MAGVAPIVDATGQVTMDACLLVHVLANVKLGKRILLLKWSPLISRNLNLYSKSVGTQCLIFG
jgi:hypothetical protein